MKINEEEDQQRQLANVRTTILHLKEKLEIMTNLMEGNQKIDEK